MKLGEFQKQLKKHKGIVCAMVHSANNTHYVRIFKTDLLNQLPQYHPNYECGFKLSVNEKNIMFVDIDHDKRENP